MTKLLLVDEDVAFLKHLAFELHRLNPDLHCELAPGGGEALSLVDRERFDAVVALGRLPEAQGVFLVAELVERHPEVPVIAVSGRAHPGLEKVFTDFCVQWLVRPFDAAELNRLVLRTDPCRRHRGALRRVHLGNFIRSAHEHGRSITVEVQNIATGGRAILELTRGRVTGVVFGDLPRERAFHEISLWGEVNLQITNGPRFREELRGVLASKGDTGLGDPSYAGDSPGEGGTPPLTLEDVFGPGGGTDD